MAAHKMMLTCVYSILISAPWHSDLNSSDGVANHNNKRSVIVDVVVAVIQFTASLRVH